MDTQLYLMIAVLVVALAALLTALLQTTRGRRLERRVQALQEQLDNRQSVTAAAPPPRNFSAHLSSAEQSQFPAAGKPVAQAEKYRYAAALAAQGHGVAGIATALQMAPAEVAQVMRLAHLQRPSQDNVNG
jgi:Flp pilus assembly protein TadB